MTENTNTDINTWYKLRDGTWGAKLRHPANPGDCVMLVTKKGEEKPVWLISKVATFPDASLWTCTSEEPENVVEEPF